MQHIVAAEALFIKTALPYEYQLVLSYICMTQKSMSLLNISVTRVVLFGVSNVFTIGYKDFSSLRMVLYGTVHLTIRYSWEVILCSFVSVSRLHAIG